MHYLLDNFADVNSQNKAGETPLFLAAEAYNRECAKVNNFLCNNYLLVNLINDCREIIFLSFHNSRRLILIFSDRSVRSTVYLAAVNDNQACANW